MKSTVCSALGLFLLVSSAQASFYPYGASPCALSHASDSYGRGVKAAFLGGDQRPDLLDSSCYAMGFYWGRELSTDTEVCQREFRLGHKRGFSRSTTSGGTECYIAGYSAGTADLRIGARLGDRSQVGSKCVDEYVRGRADGQQNLAATAPDWDPTAVFCYDAGYFDAKTF